MSEPLFTPERVAELEARVSTAKSIHERSFYGGSDAHLEDLFHLEDLLRVRRELAQALKDCMEDLQSEVDARLPEHLRNYPSINADYERDTAAVRVAKAALRNAGVAE